LGVGPHDQWITYSFAIGEEKSVRFPVWLIVDDGFGKNESERLKRRLVDMNHEKRRLAVPYHPEERSGTTVCCAALSMRPGVIATASKYSLTVGKIRT
jgi:hypothetical protein